MSSSGPPTPNGDENRQGGILGTTIVVTILASVVVALRMATRIWIVRNVGWDDYTILCATIGIIMGCGLVVVQVHYGFGRHKFYLTDWQFIEFTKYSYGEWFQTFQTLMFNKLSICFLLIRIPVEKHFIRPIQGAIMFLVVTNIILTLLWIFQCNPIAGTWNKMTPATCFTDAQLQRIIISQAIISIISDFVLALFPIVLLWKVQIAVRIKAGLCYKALTSGINSYLSHRSFRKSTSGALVDQDNDSSKPGAFLGKIFHPQGASHKSALEAAAYTVSVEAGRAQAYGAGEEGFAMQNLPGDKATMTQGIQKTTTIDIDDTSAPGSQRSLSSPHGKGENSKYFV
ncbi:MAG: hypothetical protein LQ346_006323 [Caloplaca aetnensis]|nr:MAG: hypothetical protein LQ346_006323 [Caloplaca aetnensis]